MGRIIGGPYSTNKNLTALSTENLIDTFSYTPGVGGPYSQASKALPDRWKAKQIGTSSPKGAASACMYGGTVMGNALFVRPAGQRLLFAPHHLRAERDTELLLCVSPAFHHRRSTERAGSKGCMQAMAGRARRCQGRRKTTRTLCRLSDFGRRCARSRCAVPSRQLTCLTSRVPL